MEPKEFVKDHRDLIKDPECDAVSFLKSRLGRACDIIEALTAELESYRWIPVTERLPELNDENSNHTQSKWVQVTDGEGAVDAYYYDYTKREAKPNYATGKGWYCHGIRKDDITHFRYVILPEQTLSGGKQKEHPEHHCQLCGGRNVTWYVENELWNKVMGSLAAICCPICFVELAEKKEIKPTSWLLTLESGGATK